MLGCLKNEIGYELERVLISKKIIKDRPYLNQGVPGPCQKFGPIGTPRVLNGPPGCQVHV